MGKNLKKVLSYALGVILAMGIGLTYAYAVGANDSNAFVTTTEWETKIAKIKASIDNVNKTINDNNMDYVMNSPRLQASLIEGFENSGSAVYAASLLYSMNRPREQGNYQSRYFNYNMTQLYDTWDGRQSIALASFTGSDGVSGALYGCKYRYALRSDDPNIYLVFSVYYGGVDYSTPGYQSRVYMFQVFYFDITKSPQNYSSAKAVEVTLPLSEWGTLYGTDSLVSRGRTSANVYTGSGSDTSCPPFLEWQTNNNPVSYKLSNPGTGYISSVVSGSNITYKFEFPATAYIIRQTLNSSPYCAWDAFPLDLRGRKMGGQYDQIYINGSASTYKSHGTVAKVFSPQKNCICLKQYRNGEIPILNE